MTGSICFIPVFLRNTGMVCRHAQVEGKGLQQWYSGGQLPPDNMMMLCRLLRCRDDRRVPGDVCVCVCVCWGLGVC